MLLLFSLALAGAVENMTKLEEYRRESCSVSAWNEERLECEGYDSEFFPLGDGFGALTEVKISGNFSALHFLGATENVSYAAVEKLKLSSPRLVLDFRGLAPLEGLVEIEVTDSRVLEITGSGKNLTELRELRFMRSSFQNASDLRRLEELPSLHALYLVENNLTTAGFHVGALPSGIGSLGIASNPRLTGLGACAALRGMTELTDLHVVETGVEEFEFACVPPGVEVLNLDSNPRARFHFTGLGKLRALRTLSLNYNTIPSFDASLLPVALTRLFLMHSAVSSVTCGAQLAAALRFAALNNNALERAPLACLGGDRLESLDLSANRIAGGIDCSELARFSNLSTIRLNRNRITDFGARCAEAGRLGLIELADNALTSFDYGAVVGLNRTVDTFLSGNSIRCDCPLLVDFLRALSSEQVRVTTDFTSLAFTCRHASPLAGYSFANDVARLRELDDRSEGCALRAPLAPSAGVPVTVAGQRCVYHRSKLRCLNFYAKRLPYAESLADLESVHVEGFFDHFAVDPSYRRVRQLTLHSVNMSGTLDLASLLRAPDLLGVDVSDSGIDGVRLPDVVHQNLARMRFSDNRILELDLTPDQFPRLAVLELDGNRLSEFRFGSLPATIRRLNLARNRIASVSLAGAGRLESLLFVDLSFNRLVTLAIAELPPALQLLDVGHNRVATLPAGADRAPMPPGLVFEMRGNRLTCDCALYGTFDVAFRAANVTVCAPSDEPCARDSVTCDPGSELFGFPWHDPDALREVVTFRGRCSAASSLQNSMSLQLITLASVVSLLLTF
ncbi:MAG: hypothetical protein AAFP26_09410 [Planctomycetota bacterium]